MSYHIQNVARKLGYQKVLASRFVTYYVLKGVNKRELLFLNVCGGLLCLMIVRSGNETFISAFGFNVLKIRRKATCLPSILPALFKNVLYVLI